MIKVDAAEKAKERVLKNCVILILAVILLTSLILLLIEGPVSAPVPA